MSVSLNRRKQSDRTNENIKSDHSTSICMLLSDDSSNSNTRKKIIPRPQSKAKEPAAKDEMGEECMIIETYECVVLLDNFFPPSRKSSD